MTDDNDSPWYGLVALAGWLGVGVVILIVGAVIFLGGR